MADNIKLEAKKRTLIGRKVKKMRREGMLPANIFGNGVKSAAITIAAKEFATVFAKAGETNVISIDLDKEAKPRPVLVNNIHRDPVTDDILHIDFQQIDLTKKVTVSVPIELTGESPAENKGGVVIHLISEVEVEALPGDLPDKFILDVSKLEEINQNYSFKDLKVSDKVKLLVENMEEMVVKVDEPTKEEVAPVVEAAPAEGEEGAAPAEGEEAKSDDKKDDKKEEKKEDSKKEA